MQNISDLLTIKKPVENIRSERDEQINNFYNLKVIKLRDRKTRELRTATKTELALLLRHCPTKDLYPFYKSCEQARSFSRFFWWSLKKKGSNTGHEKTTT